MTLPHSNNITQYPARFQFQSGAPCGGSSCCTDTCIQMVVEYYKDRTYSLATIRRLAQAQTSFNEAPCTGINRIEVLNALNSLGVTHYRYAAGVDASFVHKKLAIGPVMIGVHYGSYPAYANSSRRPRCENGGRTDFGFSGAHMVLGIRAQPHKDSRGNYLHTDFLVRDPDHFSSPRPRWDRMPMAYIDRAMKALPAKTPFTSTYVIYPTRRK